MALRNQMRETLKNVDAKLETADADAKVADPVSLLGCPCPSLRPLLCVLCGCTYSPPTDHLCPPPPVSLQMLESARNAAKERLKLPPHLRGSAVLNETL